MDLGNRIGSRVLVFWVSLFVYQEAERVHRSKAAATSLVGWLSNGKRRIAASPLRVGIIERVSVVALAQRNGSRLIVIRDALIKLFAMNPSVGSPA